MDTANHLGEAPASVPLTPPTESLIKVLAGRDSIRSVFAVPSLDAAKVFGTNVVEFGAGKRRRPMIWEKKMWGRPDAEWRMTTTANPNLAKTLLMPLASDLLPSEPGRGSYISNAAQLEVFAMMVMADDDIVADKAGFDMPYDGSVDWDTKKLAEYRTLDPAFRSGDKVKLPLAATIENKGAITCQYGINALHTLLTRMEIRGPNETRQCEFTYNLNGKIIGIEEKVLDGKGILQKLHLDHIEQTLSGETAEWMRESLDAHGKVESRTFSHVGTLADLASILKKLGIAQDFQDVHVWNNTTSKLRGAYPRSEPVPDYQTVADLLAKEGKSFGQRYLLRVVQKKGNDGRLATYAIGCEPVPFEQDSLEKVNQASFSPTYGTTVNVLWRLPPQMGQKVEKLFLAPGSDAEVSSDFYIRSEWD